MPFNLWNSAWLRYIGEENNNITQKALETQRRRGNHNVSPKDPERRSQMEGHRFSCMLGSLTIGGGEVDELVKVLAWITIAPKHPISFKGWTNVTGKHRPLQQPNINKTHESGKTISSVHACGRRCTTHTRTHAQTHTVYNVRAATRSDTCATHVLHANSVHTGAVWAGGDTHTLVVRYSPKSTSSWWNRGRCGQPGGGERG